MRYLVFVFFLVSYNCGAQQSKDIGDRYQEVPAEDIVKSKKTDADWKKTLNEEEYRILREKGTERPFTSELLKNKKEGTYVCAACELPLFSSNTKFKSGTGWPSFYDEIKPGYVVEKSDNTYGMTRVEILCARCDGHLGHVFNDGPEPTGLRYCVNGLSLEFEPDEAEK